MIAALAGGSVRAVSGSSANALRWDGGPGHYEVYYVTLTEPETGVGVWIRYTMVAPLPSARKEATCAVGGMISRFLM